MTNAHDVRYLTGFHGEDSWALVLPRSVVIISDFRFQEELERLDGVRVHIRSGQMTPEACEVIRGSGVESVGVQSEHMTLAQRDALAQTLGERMLRPTRDLLASLRVVKDDQEIRAIGRAVALQQKALLATLETIEPGRTEADVCAELEGQMKRLGAEGASFDTIVAARANGSRPHYRPARVKLAKNQPLLIDWGAKLDGYCSDMTRTFAFGRFPKPLDEVYRVVLDAQQAAIDAIAPGKTCREIDGVARKLIADAGYGDAFGHGLGHGIGLDIHEAPRLSWRSDRELEAGMVVTVEPGVYLPGVGGVRIEDDVVVTERGARNLCSLPKAIDWALR